MPELLSSIDQISADWLQSVFSSAGVDAPGIRSVRTEPLGAGKTASTVKVVVEYETANSEPHTVTGSVQAPASLVCKMHPPEPERMALIKSSGVFLTEANVLKLLAKESQAAVPAVYFVDAAEDGSEFNLVCEDLSAFCKPGDQIEGCTIGEARAAVLELARLHRQFWKEPVLHSLDWLKPRQAFPENAAELLHARLSALLDADQYQTVQRSIAQIYDWLNRAPVNPTLIHGDCKVDNFLFDLGKPTEPKAYLIDFALAGVGDAAADVAYLLTSSLSPEDRLACEMDLLKLHSEEVARKDPGYSFEQAVEAYRDNIVSSLHLTLVAAMHVPESEHARQLFTRLLERNCAAIEHWAH